MNKIKKPEKNIFFFFGKNWEQERNRDTNVMVFSSLSINLRPSLGGILYSMCVESTYPLKFAKNNQKMYSYLNLPTRKNF